MMRVLTTSAGVVAIEANAPASAPIATTCQCCSSRGFCPKASPVRAQLSALPSAHHQPCHQPCRSALSSALPSALPAVLHSALPQPYRQLYRQPCRQLYRQPHHQEASITSKASRSRDSRLLSGGLIHFNRKKTGTTPIAEPLCTKLPNIHLQMCDLPVTCQSESTL